MKTFETTIIELLNELQVNPEFSVADMADSNLIESLLLSEGEIQQNLFSCARSIRQRHFGNKLKIRGVIEISNACKKNCDYCAMRSKNPNLDRYFLEKDQIVSIADDIISLGIKTIFLQSGENLASDAIINDVITMIVKKHDCEILLCLGEKKQETYNQFSNLGAKSYILKFETSDSKMYKNITGSSLEKRIDCMNYIKQSGMNLGTGNIIGLPNQKIDNIVSDILFAATLQPDFVSASPFIPNSGTPFENLRMGDINITLNTMAIWRILLPQALIPSVSALEYVHSEGQAAGLNAGANVITVNFTPKTNRDKYAIYTKDRFVVSLEHANKTAQKAGLVLDI